MTGIFLVMFTLLKNNSLYFALFSRKLKYSLFFCSAKNNYEKDPDRLKTVSSPWPPWRIPKETTPFYKDPRRFLHSRELKIQFNIEVYLTN